MLQDNLIGQWVTLKKNVSDYPYEFLAGTNALIVSRTNDKYDIQDIDGRQIFGCDKDCFITQETYMTDDRMKELFNNMLNHISELVSGCDLRHTLHAIGFTDEEIAWCEAVIDDE